MRQKEQFWWVSATVVSLGAFSFFAGLGLRGLLGQLSRSDQPGANALLRYPRVASAAPRVPDPDLNSTQLYTDVLTKLQIYYVDPLPSKTHMALGSVDEMLSRLNDPDTRLLGKTEVEAYRNALNGKFEGIGAVLAIRPPSQAGQEAPNPKGPLRPAPGRPAPVRRNTPPWLRAVTVVSVVPGSPAEKAGLRPGDRITELDGRWIAPVHYPYSVVTQYYVDPIGPQDYRPLDADTQLPARKPGDAEKARKDAAEASRRWKSHLDLAAAMQALAGAESGEHELTIERGRPATTLKVKVALEATRVPALTSRTLSPTSGYLRLVALNGEAVKQLGKTLGEFKQAGVKSLVLDLRNSPGGSLDAAREIAGLLAGPGKFAVLKERDGSGKLVNRPLPVKGSPVFKPASVSVLVDRGTAGASELLAAALRDRLGAKLVGSTTAGDGSEQEIMTLDNGSGVSITRARMLTSTGLDYDGKGLKPDVAPHGDPLASAVKALAANTPAPAPGA